MVTTGAGEAWWPIIFHPSRVRWNTLVAWATATPRSPSLVVVMFSLQATMAVVPSTWMSTEVGVTRIQCVLAKIVSHDQVVPLERPGFDADRHEPRAALRAS